MKRIMVFGLVNMCLVLQLRACFLNERLLSNVRQGKQGTVFVLLQAGANLHYRKDGSTALHIAARHGHLPIAEMLIRAHADVDEKDSLGQTPLHVADNRKMVKLLFDAGAGIDAPDNSNVTPLALAISNWRIDLVEELLSRDAKRDMANKAGYTPFHCAADKFNILSLLLKQPYFKEARLAKLQLQVTANSWAKQLVGMVNAVNDLGETPLHIAARGGNNKCIALLIKAGARTNMVDKHGSTPLHGAACRGNIEIAGNLLGEGIDLDIFTLAKRQRFDGDFLSNINTKDNNGNTPLHEAVICGNPDMVKFLLQKGADQSIKNNKGHSPYDLIKDLWFENLENNPVRLERLKDDLRKSFGDKTPKKRFRFFKA